MVANEKSKELTTHFLAAKKRGDSWCGATSSHE